MEVLSAVEARLRVHMRTCILYQVHVLRVMCYVHVRVCSAAVEARLLRRLATGHSVGARRNEEERRLEAERRVGRHLRSVLLEHSWSSSSAHRYSRTRHSLRSRGVTVSRRDG